MIIALTITSTLNTEDLLGASRVSTSVGNETYAFINLTGYTLANAGSTTDDYGSIVAWNITDGEVITSGNYTISTSGVLTNATAASNWSFVGINYTYTTLNDEEQSTNLLTGNFTAGINQVSAKIPTVLLVAAIVLILGILAVLVGVWRKMRLGGGTTI